jgi:signal transduction histidine kinase
MYNTDKNLQVKISVIDRVPDEFYKMKSTFIINDKISDYTDNYILVSFIDSGIGIPERNQNKIFTPFFTTKPIGEGIGLGLYVSKKIVHEHRGEIFFKGSPGETEFHVILPTG